jgi:dihydroorotate dehydrogenase
MSSKKLPNWYLQHPPIYDISKSYAKNAAEGPYFSEEIPERVFPDESEWIDFLGYSVASPIGVPAGPLLNSKFIDLALQLGYDLPVYKTIRSSAHPGHSLPNMIYVDSGGQINLKQERVFARSEPPLSIENLALTNSFGMPSKDPEFLMQDIERANRLAKKGQVVIVSVVGSHSQERSFYDDFIEAALLAKRSGAKIIEANFSCPNVDKKRGSLYTDPEVVYELGHLLSRAIHPIPLIIKVGLFKNEEQMRDVFISAANAKIKAISGLNSVSMQVVDEKGGPALGIERPTSGICGGTIRNCALDFIKKAFKINNEEKLGLTLIGVGGITQPDHFDQFLDMGADVAMSATGMMWDPYLAARYHQQKVLV